MVCFRPAGTRTASGSAALSQPAWVWRAMPDGVRPAALSRAAWAETFRSRALMLTLSVTVLFSAGQFVLFSYFSPYWRQILGVSPTQLSVMFLGFGLFGFIGNALMSRHIDRVGVDRAVFISLGLVALSLAAWPLATSIPQRLSSIAEGTTTGSRLVS